MHGHPVEGKRTGTRALALLVRHFSWGSLEVGSAVLIVEHTLAVAPGLTWTFVRSCKAFRFGVIPLQLIR